MRLLLCMALAVSASAQPALVGNWLGTLDTGSSKLRIAFRVTADSTGALRTTVDSLDQGVRGLLVREATLSDRRVRFDLAALHASYEGTMSDDGSSIAGTFIQTAPLRLDLTRVDQIEIRPQQPRPPFPYRSEEVVFTNKLGKLAGTLTIPAGSGLHPAVVLVSGSGPQDRDGSLFGHKPFLVLADYFARRGIASLRVDDRGTGASTGSSSALSLDDMAADVLSGISYLKTRTEIDPARLGLIGHSEGAMVAPIAAAQSSDVAYLVMLAGTGVPGEEVLAAQAEALGRAAGLGDEVISLNSRLQKILFELLHAEASPTAANLLGRLGERKLAMSPQDRAFLEQPGIESAIERNLATLLTPELRSLLQYNPAETLRHVKVPVLALNGSRDVQVIATQNLPAIAAALTAGGNAQHSVMTLPGLNHLFQTCKTCQIAEYGNIEETFAPTAMETIAAWIAQR